jgi:hypothetical protein
MLTDACGVLLCAGEFHAPMEPTSMSVDITGLDPARVVQALYAASQPLGMGVLHFVPGDLGYDEAKSLVGNYVDYHRGRVMKVLISGDSFEPGLYDRDNGNGTAQRVVDRLRKSSPTPVTTR